MTGGFNVTANGVTQKYRTLKQAKQAASTVSHFGIPAEIEPVITKVCEQVEVYQYDEYGDETVLLGYAVPKSVNGRIVGYCVQTYGNQEGYSGGLRR